MTIVPREVTFSEASRGHMVLRGVEVHNLRGIDLDLPRHRLIAICGVSGSGKSSLALDTLYAEGQRRYLETFSVRTRQFLQRLQRPTAQRLEGIPAAIAVSGRAPIRSPRSTVGTATGILDYLRLLFARAGRTFCLDCNDPVRRQSPEEVLREITALPAGTGVMIAFETKSRGRKANWADGLRAAGFARVIQAGRILRLSGANESHALDPNQAAFVVVDRIRAGDRQPPRILDSAETAFRQGLGECSLFIDSQLASSGQQTLVNGRPMRLVRFVARWQCSRCHRAYPELEPRLFSFSSPEGSCPACDGTGFTNEYDWDLLVPDGRKSLELGAVAALGAATVGHRMLLESAARFAIDVRQPFGVLNSAARQRLLNGDEATSTPGLVDILETGKRTKATRLAAWKSPRLCATCGGTRLRPEALAVRIGGRNLSELTAIGIGELLSMLKGVPWPADEIAIVQPLVGPVLDRLAYLIGVGLDYLTLARPMRDLSGGETRRVLMTSVLGSSLVNALYVLDEPSVGLHPQDNERLVASIRSLAGRGNSVVVVEHDESVLRAADNVVEIGPGAGERGGKVIFAGTPEGLVDSEVSLTGKYLSGRMPLRVPAQRRGTDHGWIRVLGARGHNLRNINVEIPLATLCVVTGKSGAGKSSLVLQTLYPALRRLLDHAGPPPLPVDDVLGAGALSAVTLVDQSPAGLSSRTNPATYLKAFDEIRSVFAETVDAKTHNYTAGDFSFNREGGRCPRCEGQGSLELETKFLADATIRCDECRGKRFRKEILSVHFRGRSVADVLEMTAREAFAFFRGRTRLQARLKTLLDVGLDYIRLGQLSTTLSGGESQRLKLAGYLVGARRGRTLFIMEEPTTGLHFADIVQLIDCFDALLSLGHSLVVVEHNLQLMLSADYIIDLGPGAAANGGRVVARGTPEEVAASTGGATASYLAAAMARARRHAAVPESELPDGSAS